MMLDEINKYTNYRMNYPKISNIELYIFYILVGTFVNFKGVVWS